MNSKITLFVFIQDITERFAQKKRHDSFDIILSRFQSNVTRGNKILSSLMSSVVPLNLGESGLF